MTPVALTRSVPDAIARAELTHLERTPIDLDRARRQHAQYCRALESLGCRVRELPPTPELPDSVFVEDTAVVLDELAIVTRPGAESRRPETASVAEALGSLRSLAFIEAPGLVDGGDVLRLGHQLFIGETKRTNGPGIEQLQAIAEPFGYAVHSVPVTGCLHLKSAVTQLDAATLVVNPEWVDPALFAGHRCIEVHPQEPFAANALRCGDRVLLPATGLHTRERVERAGLRVTSVEADELAKAEGGLTCCSLLVGA